jgi:hypothetical protein
MRIFIYKSLIAAVVFFVIYQITIGATVNKAKENISYLSSDENKNLIKNKIRKELKSAIKKDNYLNTEDAELIKKFFNKIKIELK